MYLNSVAKTHLYSPWFDPTEVQTHSLPHSRRVHLPLQHYRCLLRSACTCRHLYTWCKLIYDIFSMFACRERIDNFKIWKGKIQPVFQYHQLLVFLVGNQLYWYIATLFCIFFCFSDLLYELLVVFINMKKRQKDERSST